MHYFHEKYVFPSSDFRATQRNDWSRAYTRGAEPSAEAGEESKDGEAKPVEESQEQQQQATAAAEGETAEQKPAEQTGEEANQESGTAEGEKKEAGDETTGQTDAGQTEGAGKLR